MIPAQSITDGHIDHLDVGKQKDVMSISENIPLSRRNAHKQKNGKFELTVMKGICIVSLTFERNFLSQTSSETVILTR